MGEDGYNGRYIFTRDCRMTWDFRGQGKAYEEERLLVIVMKKRILITGSGGFLGSRLAEYFEGKDGYETVAVTHEELDITDMVAVSAFFKAIRPLAVLHCAGLSDTRQCEADPLASGRINVQGTENIARACRESGCRLIFMSSDQVYTGTDTLEPNRETDRVKPVNVYGRDKKRAEEAALALTEGAICLRLTWMYDYPVPKRTPGTGLLGHIFEAVEEERVVISPVHDYRGITYVWDVIRAMEQVMELPGGVYNFGSTNQRNAWETAGLFAQAAAVKTGILPKVEADLERFRSVPRNLTIDTGKMERFGICLGDTAEGLARCMKDNGVCWQWKKEQLSVRG